MDIYEEYGYYKEDLVSIEMKGKDGSEKISNILEYLRNSMNSDIGNKRIIKKTDYKISLENNLLTHEEKTIKLPKSNVLKFVLDNDAWFVVRPSGTEPKMKIYLSVKGHSLEDASKKIIELREDVLSIVEKA